MKRVIAGLLVISILLVSGISVSAQLGQGASQKIEMTQLYRDAPADIQDKSKLENLKDIIKKCKESAEAERSTFLGTWKLWGKDAFKGYKRYADHVERYDCKDKGVSLYKIDLVGRDDVFTTAEIKVNHPAFGEAEAFYDINGAELILDKYYADLYFVVDGQLFSKSMDTLSRESIESNDLSEEDMADVTLIVSKSFANQKQLAFLDSGETEPAKGEVKVAVLGKEVKILGFQVGDKIASTMYPKQKFYYDSEGSLVFECPQGFCKSDGINVRKLEGKWTATNREGEQMILRSDGKWIPLK